MGMRPAFLVDIDCDLYTSTSQALRWMLDSGLLVPGSFIYYDDYNEEAWNISPEKHAYLEERLAHEEITKEYKLRWKPLFRHVFEGPLPGVSWITQWRINGTRSDSRPLGKPLHGRDLTPVLQLEACGRCQRGR